VTSSGPNREPGTKVFPEPVCIRIQVPAVGNGGNWCVHIVHTLGFGLGRIGVGSVRIAYVSAGA
jgi:hypothetical protein